MKYTKELLTETVLKSRAMTEVLHLLNLKQSGGNYSHISKTIKKLNIDTSHFLGQGWNKGKAPVNKHTVETFSSKVLILNGLRWNGSNIKEKLYEYGLKECKCEKCNITNMWNNETIVLELDHINGNHCDNRIENLRILCPNCHSQTPTYSSKNIRSTSNLTDEYFIKTENKNEVKIIKVRKKTIKCNYCNCGKRIDNRAKKCKVCDKINQRKVIRPELNEILKNVSEIGYCATGRKYGVSDNCIRKWIKK